MDIQAHFARLQELLEREKEEDLQQYRDKVLQRSLKERIEKGVSWYPLSLKRVMVGTGDHLILDLERMPVNTAQAIQAGDAITLFGRLADREVGRVTGVASVVQKTSIRIVLGLEYTPDWVHQAQLGVDIDFDDRTYQEMFSVLRKLAGASKHERLYELTQVLFGNQPADFHRWTGTYENPVLNPSQNQAVQRILEAKDIAIVHGPPGTGKTTTLIQAIQETLLREQQVLVCAPSNTAVDLLTLRCVEAGMDVLRLGNPARISEVLQRHTLDGAITEHPDYPSLRKMRRDAEALHKQARKFKRKFDAEAHKRRRDMLREARELKKMTHQLEAYIIQQLVEHSQVITATLVGTAHTVLGNKRFHTVFMDEASQAMEPASWIPLLRANRAVLAGDHFQLPPTVKSIEAAQKGLGRSLFEQIIEAQPDVPVMLEYQYRMHEDIMRFSGSQFYRNRLKAAPEVKDRRLSPEIDPVAFIDTAGCGFGERQNPETLSLSNPEEAQLLLKHLAMLLSRLETHHPELLRQKLSIGIISPYKAQVHELRQRLQESPMLASFQELITINTVDGFQGQERDVIYISMVRSNTKGEIGFLSDIRRMNVALTRARKRLVVVGDSATLGQHPFYQEFISYVESIDAYHSAWEYLHVS